MTNTLDIKCKTEKVWESIGSDWKSRKKVRVNDITTSTRPFTMMNNRRLDQLDANVLDKNSSDTTQPPLRKGHKFRDFFGIPKSLAKVKVRTSTQSLDSQGIPSMEYELYKLQMQRLNDSKLSIYVSPMAKASLQAQDNEVFPLMGKVQEFLTSNRQVMLILGDSGAGKSTFNKHFGLRLLTEYKRGKPIPLFVNLPALQNPAKDLIGEQLREHNFSEEQIQKLKQHRQFIVICDGYDESQLTVNIHNSNNFNTSGQWNVKLVISCRSQYLGQDYRDRFVPHGGGHYSHSGVELFQEAVIAPFSTEQIKDYVEQYVPLEPRTWRTEDYMDKLTVIPNLMDLVKNPFLLSLALESLPGEAGSVYYQDYPRSALRHIRAALEQCQ
ncbi:MAG: hypothetical protein JOS17DRAFT_773263 [Linnemannia elongata]|nr:MAG: hypothetical protein JOS17DRAFT_773263 [Linnemannia elongata]